jgi:hypothetical protein
MDHEALDDFMKNKVIIVAIMAMGCEILHYSWAFFMIQAHMNISQSCMQNLEIET